MIRYTSRMPSTSARPSDPKASLWFLASPRYCKVTPLGSCSWSNAAWISATMVPLGRPTAALFTVMLLRRSVRCSTLLPTVSYTLASWSRRTVAPLPLVTISARTLSTSRRSPGSSRTLIGYSSPPSLYL